MFLDTMASPKICRICLATDVKLNYIEGLLKFQATSLFGPKSIFSPGMPHHACYECTWMIRKFSKLKEKFLIAQSIFYDILKKNKYISEEDLQQIDRRALCLQTSISLHKLPCISFYGNIKRDSADNNVSLDMIVEEQVESNATLGKACDDDKLLSQVFSDENHREDKRKGKKGRKKHKKKFLTSMSNIAGKEKLKSKDNDNDMLKDFVITKLTFPEQVAEVEKRKNLPNYRDSPYRCDICYKGFLKVDTLNNHTIRHDPISGVIVCDVCQFRFHTRRTYLLHVARHKKKFSCIRCNFTAVHIDQAKRHKQWHDGVTYKCQYCNEVSSRLTSHLSHIRMKHTSEFVCDVCGYSFVSDKGLKMHKTRMHKEYQDGDGKARADVKEPSLYCAECDMQFETGEGWKRHRANSARHGDRIGSACRTCGETFASASRLRSHACAHANAAASRARALVARRRYVPRDRRPLPRLDTDTAAAAAAAARSYPTTCEHCTETITDRSRHWKHYQRCHQNKKYPLSKNNYICEYCGKGFQANAFLVYHKRRHFDERSYKCPTCPKSFHTRSALRAHRVTHSTARPHSCTLCYKTFKTKLGLHQHIKSHSGHRPFSCQYCGKSFSRASCLTLHVTRLHTRQIVQKEDSSI